MNGVRIEVGGKEGYILKGWGIWVVFKLVSCKLFFFYSYFWSGVGRKVRIEKV